MKQTSNNTSSDTDCNLKTCFRSYCLGNGCCELCRHEQEQKCLVYGCPSRRFNVLEDQERFIDGNQTKLDLHECRKCKTVQEDIELPPKHKHANGLNDTCKVCVAHYAQILHPQGSKKKQQYAVKNPDGSLDLVDELGIGDPQTGWVSSNILDFLRKKELEMIQMWNFRFYHRRNSHSKCTIETNSKWSIKRHAKQAREGNRLYKVECSIPAFDLNFKCKVDGIDVEIPFYSESKEAYIDFLPQLYKWQRKAYKSTAQKLLTHDFKENEIPYGKGKIQAINPDSQYGATMVYRMAKGDSNAYHELRRFRDMFNPEHKPELRGMNKTMLYNQMLGLIKRYNQLRSDLKYGNYKFHTCYETNSCLACWETECIYKQIQNDRVVEEPRFVQEPMFNSITGTIEFITVDLENVSKYKDDDRRYTGIEFPYTEQFPITLELIEAEIADGVEGKAPNGFNDDTTLVTNKRGIIHMVVSTKSTYAPNTNPEKDSHETSIDMAGTCEDPKTA